MIDESHKEDFERGESVFFSSKAVRGVPWMIMAKLILFFIYFGVSIVTVNSLGREQFGVFSLMTNIASYMLVACGLGLGAALTRYVPELATRKNLKGLIHLLRKSASLQVVATAVFSGMLLYFSEPLQRLFQAEHVEHFRLYLMLACALAALMLLKEFVATVFTAIFETRVVATFSVTQGIIWFIVLFSWLIHWPNISTALASRMFSLALIYTIGAFTLVRYVKNLNWKTDEFGIGKRRALRFSGTAMLGAILRLIMFKYSEIFFLAAVGGTTLAGLYDLGYSLPYSVITFIPLALLSLSTAAFVEAYVKDNNCIGRLISSYYKLLIIVSLPAAVLGVFFAPVAYHIIYNGTMDEAGRLASAFCVILLLPLISIPLSMALRAKEKVHNMLPLMLLQIAINLFLDWLLIVKLNWGVWGGATAVVGTFVLTIVPRMIVVRRIIGGIYFPVGFFLRITMILVVDAAALFWFTNKVNLFNGVSNNILNTGLLFMIALLYALIFLLLVRVFRLVRKHDIVELRGLKISWLNMIFDKVLGV